MFRYVVYEGDGVITQANRVFDPKGYPDVLHDRGIAHVVIPGAGPGIDPEKFFVDPDRKIMRHRLPMRPQVSAGRVRAGREAVVIRHLPRPCRVSVAFNGMLLPQVASIDLPDGELEFVAPQPGRYRVMIQAFPHQAFAVEIEATE